MRERRGRFDPNQEEGLMGVGVRGEKEEEDLNMSWCDRPKGWGKRKPRSPSASFQAITYFKASASFRSTPHTFLCSRSQPCHLFASLHVSPIPLFPLLNFWTLSRAPTAKKDVGICEQEMGPCLHCMVQAFGSLRLEVSPGQGIREGAWNVHALSRATTLLAPPHIHQLIMLVDGNNYWLVLGELKPKSSFGWTKNIPATQNQK